MCCRGVDGREGFGVLPEEGSKGCDGVGGRPTLVNGGGEGGPLIIPEFVTMDIKVGVGGTEGAGAKINSSAVMCVSTLECLLESFGPGSPMEEETESTVKTEVRLPSLTVSTDAPPSLTVSKEARRSLEGVRRLATSAVVVEVVKDAR